MADTEEKKAKEEKKEGTAPQQKQKPKDKKPKKPAEGQAPAAVEPEGPPPEPAPRARLLDYYEQRVRAKLAQQFGLKNPHEIPKLVKIVLNVGPKGTLGAINVVDAKELGKEAVDCMTKAVKAAKPDVSTCKDKKVEMMMAFGAAAKT